MRLLVFALSAAPLVAYAQEKPPTLTRFAQAEYPAAALAAGVEGEVLFSLTVERDGVVSEARLIESAGFGFDEAALSAVLRFGFTPATKDGAPVRAQILYKYRFSLTQRGKQASPFAAPLDAGNGEPPASQFGEAEFIEVLPPGALTGTIFERGTRDPIPFALIAVMNQDKVLREITADERGRFTLLGIVPGRASIKVIASGYEALTSLEEIPGAGMLSVDFRLLPESSTGFGLVVRGEELNQEVTRRVLSPEELEKIPGSRGDVLKGIQNLPGLARTLLGLGGLVVRGSAPEDTQVFLDGMPIPLLYHFGGLTSVISEDFISGITFLPGVFSARYGRGMGGVIEVETKLSEPPRLQGSIDTDILDTGVMLKGKLPIEGMRYAVAARRSYLDLPLSLVQTVGVDLGVAIFPRYADYQGAVSVPLWGGDAQLIAFGSSDRFEITGEDEEPEDFVSLTSRFHRVQASWKKEVEPGVKRRAAVSFGVSNSLFLTPPAIEFDLRDLSGVARVDWANKLNEKLVLQYGGDLQLHQLKSTIVLEVDEELPPLEVRNSDARIDTSAYVEAVYQPIDGVTLIPGLRVDWLGVSEQATLDPRFAARWQVSVQTALKLGAGVFHQDPKPQDFLSPESPPPHAQYATQVTLGVDQALFEERLVLEASAYYKQMKRQIVRGFTLGDFPAEILTSEGEGRVAGLEVLLRYPPRENFFGWVAYSLSRAERRATPEDEWVLFDLDQTHSLTALGSYQFKRDVSVGWRFRLISGDPYTPVVFGLYDADADGYQPIFGAENSARLPPFHQLDLRIDKTYRKDAWSLALYFEVTNVYNNRNIEFDPDYNFDFTQPIFERIGLPILPVLGLEGKF